MTPDDWETAAIRAATLLDAASKEVGKLIDDIRRRRDEQDEENRDARRKS